MRIFQFSFNWDILIGIAGFVLKKFVEASDFQFSFNWDILIDLDKMCTYCENYSILSILF